jgi:hypothetical protein
VADVLSTAVIFFPTFLLQLQGIRGWAANSTL